MLLQRWLIQRKQPIGAGKEVNELLQHEGEFRSDLMHMIADLRNAKQIIESEKKDLRQRLDVLTEKYRQIETTMVRCKNTPVGKCPLSEE